MRILHLTLKKRWFDMYLSGEKKEEYRECKPYWEKRFIKRIIQCHVGADVVEYEHYDIVRFTNGYGKNAPSFDIEFKHLFVGHGIAEWGGDPMNNQLVIRVGEILETRNIKP